MADRVTIKIDGLAEFRRNVKKLDADLPKMIRVVFNQATTLVIDWAKPRIPHRSGRAAASLKARSGQTEARVSLGGRRAPYTPWLDFGGRVGRGRSVSRPFLREGRYLYVGLRARRDEVTAAMNRGLVDVARAAGIEVD